ncbi:MAG TPA: hypothetical protein DCO93_03900 [Clostridiales bacterium]|nr:hypothetical protein [Clostridiales bacterium]
MNEFKKREADINAFYKVANNVNLPIKIFMPNEKVKKNKSIMLIHGGGFTDAITDNSEWKGGWMANNAKYLAENGFLSVVISYRSLELSDGLTVLDLLQDCIDAIMYIRKNYSFVNFEDITYIGESAGGYFATMLGLSQDDNLRPKKIVAANPVLDSLDTDWKYGFKGLDNTEKFKPINCIEKKCAEFLFLHGTDDDVVKIEDTEELHKALVKCGHSSRFVKIPNKGHAFMLYDFMESDEFVTKIMDSIIDFIVCN